MTTTNAGATLGMAGSYNAHSKPQFVAVESSIPFIQRAIDVLEIDFSSISPLIIADFGSAHGANSIYAMKTIIDYLRETKKNTREILVVHNDLPANDWASVFQLLADDNSYNAVVSGRSFYEQCLPNDSLSIGYSSTSIHCSGTELAAFKSQARLDYAHFLEQRSRELASGGVLILAILCINNQGESGFEIAKDLLYTCAQALPLTEEELHDYTIPFYIRSYEECVNEELFTRCSLQTIKSEFCRLPPRFSEKWQEGQMTLEQFARGRAQHMRSWTESALRQALEMNKQRSKEEIEQLLDRFWMMYQRKVEERPHEHCAYSYRTYLVLKKIHNP